MLSAPDTQGADGMVADTLVMRHSRFRNVKVRAPFCPRIGYAFKVQVTMLFLFMIQSYRVLHLLSVNHFISPGLSFVIQMVSKSRSYQSPSNSNTLMPQKCLSSTPVLKTQGLPPGTQSSPGGSQEGKAGT